MFARFVKLYANMCVLFHNYAWIFKSFTVNAVWALGSYPVIENYCWVMGQSYMLIYIEDFHWLYLYYTPHYIYNAYIYQLDAGEKNFWDRQFSQASILSQLAFVFSNRGLLPPLVIQNHLCMYAYVDSCWFCNGVCSWWWLDDAHSHWRLQGAKSMVGCYRILDAYGSMCNSTHSFYAACVLLGLQFLHEKGIVYRLDLLVFVKKFNSFTTLQGFEVR